MLRILIGSQNPHKQKKLAEMVAGQLEPFIAPKPPQIEETGNTFEEVARNKALAYAQWFNGLAISTDGGAVIPALSADEWEPLKTRRFGHTDQERIQELLRRMRNKDNRTMLWLEAIAIADPKGVLFSATAQAMDGVIDRSFNPAFYREGIWLCSITSFPHFGGRNYFELTAAEQEQTEDSWTGLSRMAAEFFKNKVR